MVGTAFSAFAAITSEPRHEVGTAFSAFAEPDQPPCALPTHVRPLPEQDGMLGGGVWRTR